MASTTTNLGLMKPAYSDDADISDISGNMDLIDAEAGRVRANVAANYDSSETYAVGDYCLHDGSLYKCNTTISSPEAWTAGHWTQIKITGELSTLNGKMENVLSYELYSTNIVIYRVGHVVYLVCKNGNYNCTNSITPIKTTDNIEIPAIPLGYRPVNQVEAFDGSSQKRIFIDDASKKLIGLTSFSNTALRFSMCWITSDNYP
jgi:hypothetical protein